MDAEIEKVVDLFVKSVDETPTVSSSLPFPSPSSPFLPPPLSSTPPPPVVVRLHTLNQEGKKIALKARVCSRDTSCLSQTVITYGDGGIVVPETFEDLPDVLSETYDVLVASAQELGLVHKPAALFSTFSDERGKGLLYAGMRIKDAFKEDIGFGGFADRGSAVSGANEHDCCYSCATRAGKNLISSLASGLLTNGSRFGDALDEAASIFSNTRDTGLTPRPPLPLHQQHTAAPNGSGAASATGLPPLPANAQLSPSVTHVSAVPLADARTHPGRVHGQDHGSSGVDGGGPRTCWWVCNAQVEAAVAARNLKEKLDLRLKVPGKLKPGEAKRAKQLAPRRLEFDAERHKNPDAFVQNWNDPIVTPKVFAQSVIDTDYGLSSSYHATIIKDDDLRMSFLPSIAPVARSIAQIQSCQPIINYLSDGEPDRLDKGGLVSAIPTTPVIIPIAHRCVILRAGPTASCSMWPPLARALALAPAPAPSLSPPPAWRPRRTRGDDASFLTTPPSPTLSIRSTSSSTDHYPTSLALRDNRPDVHTGLTSLTLPPNSPNYGHMCKSPFASTLAGSDGGSHPA
ncbi:hypothetical protein DFH11DRAFT_1810577 [Phellopilus nigrolimitatus]|nr:hypothetical protein DFH11DRAFT_1810577 [Phellopilus nigrolimitatus]